MTYLMSLSGEQGFKGIVEGVLMVVAAVAGPVTTGGLKQRSF